MRPSIAIILLLNFGTLCSAMAEDFKDQDLAVSYFDENILTQRGIGSEINRYFSNTPRFKPGKTPVSFVVNHYNAGVFEASFSDDGELCLTQGLYDFLKIAPSDEERVRLVGHCYTGASERLSATFKLDPSKSLIEVTIPLKNISALTRLMPSGSPAAFFNYSLSSFDSSSESSKGRYSFLDTSVGLNAGGWAFRSSLNANQFSSNNSKSSRISRGFTYAQRSFDEARQTLQIGEIWSRGQIFGGTPFVGAQWFPEVGLMRSSNFIKNITAVKSRVELRQNGVLLVAATVEAGPFELSGFELPNPLAPLELKIIEDNGQVKIINLSTASVQNRSILETNDDASGAALSIAAGRVTSMRRESSLQSPRSFISLEKTFNSWAPFDVKWGGILADSYVAAGGYAGTRLFPGFAYNVQTVVANDLKSNSMGALVSSTVSWRPASTFGVNLNGGWSSKGYKTLQDASYGTALKENISYSKQVGVSANYTTDGWGSFGISYLTLVNKIGVRSTSTSASWGGTWRGINFSIAFTDGVSQAPQMAIDYNQLATGTSSRQKQLYISASIPLGNSDSMRTYARKESYSNQSTIYGVSYDKIENEILSYRLAAEKFDGDGINASGSIHLMPYYSSLNLGLSQGFGSKTTSAAASGSVSYNGEVLAASPYPVSDTVVFVKSEVPGIKLNTPQGPVWTTSSGAAISGFAPYKDFKIEVDAVNSPENVVVGASSQTTRVRRGGTPMIDLYARRVDSVILVVDKPFGFDKSQLSLFRGDDLVAMQDDDGTVIIEDFNMTNTYVLRGKDNMQCKLSEFSFVPAKAEAIRKGSAKCK